MNDEAVKKTEKAKKAFGDALGIMKKIGVGTAALVKKLKKDRSPAALIAAIDAQLEETTGRKEQAAADLEKLHGAIVAKKAEHKQASRARQEILEAELKSLLSRYDAAKRTYKILLENEQHMSLVKGRLGEVSAYKSTPVSESLIDDVIDSLDEAADQAEGVSDAARDLEKAGKRRERESDRENLWSALDGFDEEEPAVPDVAEAGAGAGEKTEDRRLKTEDRRLKTED